MLNRINHLKGHSRIQTYHILLVLIAITLQSWLKSYVIDWFLSLSYGDTESPCKCECKILYKRGPRSLLLFLCLFWHRMNSGNIIGPLVIVPKIFDTVEEHRISLLFLENYMCNIDLTGVIEFNDKHTEVGYFYEFCLIYIIWFFFHLLYISWLRIANSYLIETSNGYIIYICWIDH